jgi:hypothetical protein
VTKKIKKAASDPYKVGDNLMEDFLHEKSQSIDKFGAQAEGFSPLLDV